MKINASIVATLSVSLFQNVNAFAPSPSFSPIQNPNSALSMAMDDAMLNRLDGISRSYQELTE
eukprot:CAMPEP_0197258528 /NCGR_PEP_ID=MMETSP1429-20130617/82374_1 /TAXON_ID=49237 /ORGANISM="Chaetoceros  sp., Strain UNC1202" /LENGTH=62 /DNA_ID=CAMNT_0042722655 /DNA_START=39 /DNA_END=224 /DNA_ORIENTATION=+